MPPVADRPRAIARLGLLGIGFASAFASAHPSPAHRVDDPPRLEPVQVSASAGRPRTVFDTPATVTVRNLDDESTRTRQGVSLSEVLDGVPGLMARDRQNLAQDLQVSIRGFGSRATFGIRGVRILLDGMPLTMPDGQGQASNLPLAALSRIEVLRGPASSLYGNAAGGVIQAFTANGRDSPGLRVDLRAGSDGLQREGVNLRGASGAVDGHLDLAHLVLDGYRRHSHAERSTLHARLGFDGPVRVTFLANGLEQPITEDPLGLDEQQLREDPRQAPPQALAFDTRKSVRHRQAGIVVESRDASGWRVMAYGGHRDIVQFLAVPVAAQSSPTSGGGVIDLSSGFAGMDARWSRRMSLGGRALEATLGVATDRQRQHRLGFENFIGARLGVAGALRRDQVDTVTDRDLYGQVDWGFAPDWNLQLGWRHSRVRFRSEDAYIVPGNPDDSGEREFSAASPVASLGWRVSPGMFLYASWGRGFETPTFDELGYRPDGSAGLNFQLDASRSRSLELGGRGRRGALAWQASVFRTLTDTELAVASNRGGRSSYDNGGPAVRVGVEASLQWQAGARWRHELAWTHLDAHYRQAFLACTGIPCTAPSTPVAAGTRLAGTAPDQLWLASIRSQGPWEWRLEMQAMAPVTANTTGEARAAGYAVLDTELAHAWGEGRRAFVRIDNLFDRRYVGSVIVNEGNGRYFEPGPGRQLVAGLAWRW